MRLRRLFAALTAALVVVTALAAAPATAAPAVRFTVTASAPSIGSGGSVIVTVTAVAGDGTTDTAYAGTVGITATDSSAGLPAGGTLTNGTRSFTVSLTTPGTQAISAVDTGNGSISGSVNVVVYGALSRLTVAVTSPIPVSGSGAVVVTGRDVNGNVVVSSTDTVQVTTSDGVLLASGPLTVGVANLVVAFSTPGARSIVVTDTSNGSVAGATATITVFGAASRLAVGAVAPTAGARQPFTVTAVDTAGLTVTTFTDSVQLTTSDPYAEVSSITTAAAGIASFTVIFHTAGSQTVTATDTANTGVVGSSIVTVLDKPLTRVAGTTRVGTAVAASQQEFTTSGASAVVLARADDFADALAGGPLADAKAAPLLLTGGTDLDPAVRTEIQRVLSPNRTVYLLGGTAALSPSIADTLTADGYQVVRYAGPDRYATAASIATNGLGGPTIVILATGTSYADALAAGPAASEIGAALLLTNGRTLPSATADYLTSHAGSVYAVGQPAATAYPAASPIVGADRYATAAAVANQWFGAATVVGFASGTAFPDALAGGAHVGSYGGPMLLVDPASSTVPSATAAYLTTVRDATKSGFVYGGEGAVSAPLLAAITAAID